MQGKNIRRILTKLNIKYKICHHESFVEISKNLTRYKSENNFVGPSK